MVEAVNGHDCGMQYGPTGDASVGVRGQYRQPLEADGRNTAGPKIFTVDIMDAEGPDVVWPIPKRQKSSRKTTLAKNIENYDSMLVLAHFKGHPMGGYGGALKQLSIGCASRAGKALIHSAGKNRRPFTRPGNSTPSPGGIPRSDGRCGLKASLRISKARSLYIKRHEKNLSVDCDCLRPSAEDPCMQDIGILASLDPVAIDQACIDLVMQSDDPGKEHFMERVNSRNGIHTIEAAAELGTGSREYTLIEL